MTPFGKYIREKREALDKRFGGEYSLRKTAKRVGIQPSYLSKIERDEVPPPSEATIMRIAAELREDTDVVLALAGKVSSDLRQAIMRRPQLFAELIRQLRDAPDRAVECVVREARAQYGTSQ